MPPVGSDVLELEEGPEGPVESENANETDPEEYPESDTEAVPREDPEEPIVEGLLKTCRRRSSDGLLASAFPRAE